MKFRLAMIFLVSALALGAQTVANPSNVLHPIMKDIHHPKAPSSLDRDPAMKAELENSAAPGQSGFSANNGFTHSAKDRPAIIIAQVDPNLSPSKLNIIGTITGIKGKLDVKNVGSQVVVPRMALAVCDRDGFKIGDASRTGAALAPSESETIELLATNVGAVDLKLERLSAGSHAQ